MRVSGADRILSLDGGADPDALPRPRRLAGGVVAAPARRSSRSARTAPAHARRASAARRRRPPDRRHPRLDPRRHRTRRASAAPAASRRAEQDTGSLTDTTEPDPGLIERISEGTHTTIQPPEPEGPSEGRRSNDHDGSTVHRPELASHLRHAPDTVLAVSCPTGHLTPADSQVCRVCHRPVAPQEPRRVPRPRSAGCGCPPGRSCRSTAASCWAASPAPLEGSTDWPHLVHLPSDHTFVSRMHLHIELDGWNVLARDLDSPGWHDAHHARSRTEHMRAGEAYVLEPGCSLDLAEVYEVRSRSVRWCPVSAPVIGASRSSSTWAAAASPTSSSTSSSGRRQRVAVKVVRPDVPLNDREKRLFTAEANAMARLADHPYIVSVITAGVTVEGGRPYLVMRYCPPPDLGVRVRSNPMAVVDAVSTGIKLASAIETAHRSGILHRDIKPSNVLVTNYHEPALTDFGIAGHIADVEGESDVRISYPWSPPELLDGRSNGSVTSDVYSLGATIWHLLVGRSPFSIPAVTTRPAPSAPASCTPPLRPPSAPTCRRRSTGCSSSAWPRTPRTVRRARSSWRAASSRSRPRPTGRAPPSRSRATAPTPRCGHRAGAGGGPHRDEGGHGDLGLRSSADRRDGTGRRRDAEETGGVSAVVWAVIGRRRARAGRRPGPQRRRGRRRPGRPRPRVSDTPSPSSPTRSPGRPRSAASGRPAVVFRVGQPGPGRSRRQWSGRRSAATFERTASRPPVRSASRCAWRCSGARLRRVPDGHRVRALSGGDAVRPMHALAAPVRRRGRAGRPARPAERAVVATEPYHPATTATATRAPASSARPGPTTTTVRAATAAPPVRTSCSSRCATSSCAGGRSAASTTPGSPIPTPVDG